MRPLVDGEKLESSINQSTGEEVLTAAAACALLDVKPATLYAYVSRGLIRSLRVGRARARLYVASDVRRVATRAAARRGHGPVAAGALRWGEPVLESAITSVHAGVLAYRGVPVTRLVDDGVGFEAVAALLWQAAPAPWPAPRARAAHAPLPPVTAMLAALPRLAAADPHPWLATVPNEQARARALCVALAAATGARFARGDGLARALCRGLDVPLAHGALVDAVLVAVADHELNASTFAARIAAGAGADLYACVGAALYTFTGARHGGAPARIAAFLDDLPRQRVAAALRARLAHGDGLPGFGHPLYPAGDPRTRVLLPLLPRATTAAGRRRLDHARAVIDAGHALTGEHPSLDYALVMVAAALGLAPAWAGGLFALGRCAGWIAHALEQRASGGFLRPRARYVGPPVTDPGASSSSSTAAGSGARWSDGSIK
ncbi:MAG: citrate synthase [Kofleriaceae bacterium]